MHAERTVGIVITQDRDPGAYAVGDNKSEAGLTTFIFFRRLRALSYFISRNCLLEVSLAVLRTFLVPTLSQSPTLQHHNMDVNTTSNAPILGALPIQTLAGMAHTLQTAAIAALIFAICAFLPKLKHRAQLAKLPVFEGSTGGEKHRQGYLKSAKDLYNEGYQKVRRGWLLAHPHLT
jgi:hypothetical protein